MQHEHAAEHEGAPEKLHEGHVLRGPCRTIATVAYDEKLAGRIRELLSGEPDLTEQKMFGGLAFLIGGNMAVAASGQGGVLVRVDPAESDTLVATTNARLMRCGGAACGDGYASTRMTFAPSASSPCGWSAAPPMPARYPRSGRRLTDGTCNELVRAAGD
jgi:hypothetical protein